MPRPALHVCAGMVDIETMSTRPDALILSVGAILFDPFTLDTPDSLRQGHTFYRNVTLESQPNSHVCPDTVAWWETQSETARLATLADPQPVADVLRDLYNFLLFRGGQTHPPAMRLWANGPNFDCVILESAYRNYSTFKMPLEFRKLRCVRTLLDTAWPDNAGKPNLDIGTKHNALDDCIQQALLVQMAHIDLGLTHPH